jgi:hypothetical protein
MHYQFGALILRHRLGREFGCFSGGVMAELVADLGAHDPVVKAIVGNNMNGDTCHVLNFEEVSRMDDQWQRIGGGTMMVINFRQLEETRQKLTPVK